MPNPRRQAQGGRCPGSAHRIQGSPKAKGFQRHLGSYETAEEAEAFRGQRSAPSPWRVVLVQVEAGVVIAGLLGLVFGLPALWSALYGAATAVVPGALMARGATRLADSRSPMATAMSLLGWESAKLVCALAMLVAAKNVLHPVEWPALLVALAGCLTVYWVALAWRSR